MIINRSSVYLLILSVYSIDLILCDLHPIILIPGDGGNQVEAKLNKPETVAIYCAKKTDFFFNIWLNIGLLLPGIINCWTDNMKLLYDNETRSTSNNHGVEIRIPGFGDTRTVEFIDPTQFPSGHYFHTIADMLVAVGHVRNKTLRGAPYDFRKAPNELGKYFDSLKRLIEETYHDNHATPVMLLVHSMGGPISVHFLNMQDQAWKDKFIHKLITLSGVWGGTVKALKAYAIGDDLNSYFLSEKSMRTEQITSPSLAWLLPSKQYWDKAEVLIETPTTNYSLSNLREYFEKISFMDGWEMRKDTEPYQLSLKAPGVEVHCLYSTGVPTVNKLSYDRQSWFSNTPKLDYGYGDGTVNLRSLEGCLRWKDKQKQEVFAKQFYEIEHLEILRHENILKYIRDLVNAV